MLDRTDFASWQQRIRLYCRGKENGVNILKSIDEGPYKMGTFRETLAESTEGTPQFGPERPQVYSNLNSEEKDRYNADIRATNILLQGLPKDIYTLINHYTDAKDIWDNVKMLLEGFAKLINDMRNIKMKMSKLQLNSKFVNNMLTEWASSSTQVPPPLTESSSPAKDLIENLTNTLALLTQSYRTFLPQTNNQLQTSSNARNQATVQDGRVVVHNVQRRPNRGQGMNPRGGNATGYGVAPNRVGNDNQGQAIQGQARAVKCYNYNGTWHIARNCTQPKRPQNYEYFKDKMLLMQAQENGVALDAEQLLFLAGGQDNVFDDDVDEQPDSDILSEVPDYEHYLDATCVHHEGHVTHDNIQLDHFVDSHADYTSDSHMIPYDQYVRDNEVLVVHSGASSVPTDAFMMIYNDMCESHDPSISNTSRNTVVKNSLTAELATYKEHVELYEQRAKFKLIE
uniref:Retrovirus-related Pol polyprotein from transposon TNT 1-94 n=1 Tax=Tanacetum cinerariifolium TaxID=118510 RepID=A0A699GRZ1_TANCI|nr:hypothetical protein [Tanacetum cinerariifolium]